jgi:eukaryotic-like serine/threonine-protein kinase
MPPRTTVTGEFETSRVRRALADRYRIERVLGEGGMATVYLADDLKHHRKVAVKVMRSELASSFGAGRFLREIEIAARLSHPHILPVFDSGETAGLLYYVMPYVKGESLRDRLQREGYLSVEETLALAREVADALGYAHREGVIHRDVKPANVMLSEGHALVADFGIARAADEGQSLTGTGLAVGTPQYMSPEQAGGERDIDARSDVYALGATMYEMLAGAPPYVGSTPRAVLAMALTEDVTPLSVMRPGVPEAVAAVVAKAMGREPDARYASGAELAQALAHARETQLVDSADRAEAVRSGESAAGARPPGMRSQIRKRHLIGAAALLVLAVVLAGVFLLRSRGPAAGPGMGIRLAVLPFENRGNSADDYVVAGITDQVRGKLAALSGFQVTGRTSSEQYRRSTKAPAEIGRELGVRYLLSATVSWAKDARGSGRVQVVPELLDVRTGAVKWQQSFDAPLTDVFQVQADVAVQVASALDVALGAGERRDIAARPTANLAAYDAFLKGKEALEVGGLSDMQRAMDLFQQAVALDSTFAQAWAYLAQAQGLYFTQQAATPAAGDRARVSAERAMALAPDAADSYGAMASYYLYVGGDLVRARREIDAGLRRAPNDIELILTSAQVERAQGRYDAALELLTRARSLDPRNVTVHRILAGCLLWLRRPADALAAVEAGLIIAPDMPALVEMKAMVMLTRGDLPGARAWLREAISRADPTGLVTYTALYWDLFWALDDAQQQFLLRLSPAQFGDDRAAWALAVAGTYVIRGAAARSRAFGDTAAAAWGEQLRAAPNDGPILSYSSLSLAYAGRRAEALGTADRALTSVTMLADEFMRHYYWHILARAYTYAGAPEKAIDLLERLLGVPYFITRDWLRIDPSWDALRGNPRFQRLVAGT